MKDNIDPTSTYEPEVDEMTYDVQTETIAVRLNASNRIVDFFTSDWLSLEDFFRFRRKAKLLKVLGQMAPWAAFSGELTAFEDRAPHTQTVAKNVFIVSEDGRDAILRVYDDCCDTDEAECTIPGYDPGFDKSFALIQQKDKSDSVINNTETANVFTFWEIYDDFSIVPKFRTELLKVKHEHTLGAKLCTEIAPSGKDTVRATFTIERFKGRLGFTLKLPNDPETLRALDSYSEVILEVLDSEDQNQHAQWYYRKLQGILKPICNNFLVEIFNRDEVCINRFVVKDGVPFSFMIQKNSDEFVTAYGNGDWELESPTISAYSKTVTVDGNNSDNQNTKKELNISIPTRDEETSINLIDVLTELKLRIEDFIKDFNFVFE